MAINIGFTSLASNLQLDLGVIILIVAVFGSLIFFAKGFKLGTIMLFITSACVFMVNYQFGFNYIFPIIISFISIIMLTFSLYGSNNVLNSGGVI